MVRLYHRIAELFKEPYQKLVSSNSLVAGFAKCGLWPIRPDAFEGQYTTAHQQSHVIADDEPTVDGTTGDSAVDNHTSAEDANASITTQPEDIIPVPIIKYKEKKSSSKQGKTAIVTSSPYLKVLTIEEQNRELKEQLKDAKRENRDLKRDAKKLSQAGKGKKKKGVKPKKEGTKTKNNVLNTMDNRGYK